MDDDERLREALIELETLRARETERLRETQGTLSAVEALAASADVETGISALLASISGSLGCDGVALFEGDGDRLVLRRPSAPEASFDWTAPGLLTRPRRIVDLQGTRGSWKTPPAQMAAWRALISVPLTAGDKVLVLTAHSQTVGAFGVRDAELLARLAPIVGQAILRRELERRNAFLAGVIDKSPNAVSIAEATGDLPLVYVNDAFTALSGYDRDEVLGQNCRLLSAEPPGGPERAAVRAVVDARSEGTFTLRNRRRDGTAFWNRLQLFPIEDAAGNATHIVASQTDVTARIQAEAERDQTRQRMQGALAATSDGFLILGRYGHVRLANAPFVDFMAPDAPAPDAVIPRGLAARLLDLPDTDLPEQAIDAFRVPVSHELMANDGRQLLLRAQPIPDGGAVVTISDVTPLKVGEQALRQRLAALARSLDGIAIGDAAGRVVDANPSLLALWGMKDDDAIHGRKWTSFYDPASLGPFHDAQARIRETGSFRGEARIAVNGETRTHEVSLSLVPGVGSILVARDVTDRLRETAERDDMRQRLDRAQAQERLHQVSAGLAHDFNNLLSAILGSAALLDGAQGLDAPARAATGRIQSAALRAADLIDGLLDLGAREKTAETVDLGAVVARTLDLARVGAPSTARIAPELGTRPILIEASKTDLLQIVMNLVVNAIDALGGEPGEVRVALDHPRQPGSGTAFAVGTPERLRDYATITVEDSGEGMTPETVAQVLKPYVTTKGNSGTGLGLAIVATIIEEAGGMLEIVSTPGAGTRMTVWWPAGPAVPTRQGMARGGAGDRAHLPVLVLDDAPEVAASHAGILTSAGIEAAETDDPEAALEIVAEDPEAWGCLVTDYDMPGLSGGDVIADLARIAPGLPVIVVSALARRLTDRRLAGAASVLQKPVSPDKLVAAVRDATRAGAPAQKGSQ